MAEDGIIYILKFVPAFHHAKFYVGWTWKHGLYKRLQAHRTGQGAHITRAAVEQGHRLELVADFPGTRDDERAIKRRKNTPEFVDRLKDRGMLNSQKHRGNTKSSAGSRHRSQFYDYEESEEIMSIDQSHINIVELVKETTPLKRSGNEHHGSCPECGGKDRLFVTERTGRWACRQCGIKGDAVNWVMQRDRCSFVEACGTLGVSLAALPQTSRTPRQPLVRKDQPVNNITPSKERESSAIFDVQWRKAAIEFCKTAHEHLFVKAREPMAYLKGRGFTEDTLLSAMIGYNPTSRREKWGKTEVWLPAGIVIPWVHWTSAKGISRVNIRQDNRGDGPKYIQAAGGANWLYNGDALTPGCTAVLLEGEFDALTIKQALPQTTYCGVATGSATGARLTRWIAKLALCKRVLIPCDNDEAGKRAATAWRMLLPENSRIIPVPHGKDVNEFYQTLCRWPDETGEAVDPDAEIAAWIEGEL